MAVVVGLLLVLAGCADDDDDGGGGGGGGGGNGDGIVLGSICTCSGPAGSVFALESDVVDSWVQATNDAGGINGHPVRVIEKDDAGDPAKSLQAARELVEQDRVQAIIAFATVVPGAASYLQSKDVPIIGLDQAGGAFMGPNFFATGTPLSTGSAALLDIAQRAGATNYAFLSCSEAPACAEADQQKASLAPIVGIDYGSYTISLSAPDYVSQCLAARESGVDALEAAGPGPVITKIAQECQSQQFDPLFLGGPYSPSNAVLSEPSLDGLHAWSAWPTYQGEDAVPGAKAFAEAVAEYHNDAFTDPDFHPLLMHVWASGQMFKAAAEAADIGPNSTPDDVREGLYSLQDETLDGLIPPTTYKEGESFASPCYFELVVTDGALTSNTEPICIEDSVLEALGSELDLY